MRFSVVIPMKFDRLIQIAYNFQEKHWHAEQVRSGRE